MRRSQGPSLLLCSEGARLGVREKRSISISALYTTHRKLSPPSLSQDLPLPTCALTTSFATVVRRILVIQCGRAAKPLGSGVRVAFSNSDSVTHSATLDELLHISVPKIPPPLDNDGGDNTCLIAK